MAGTLGQKGQARREQVLRTARRRLVEGGLDRFTLREVAVEADMTLGNLQYYFTTRDDLLEALVRSEFEGNLASVRGAAGHDDPLRTLVVLAGTLVAGWAGKSGRIYATLALLAFHDKRFERIYRSLYKSFYRELGQVLAEIDADASARKLEERARLITALLDGTAQQLQLGDSPTIRRRLLARVSSLVTEIARTG
jgi:AcrR family transcriptional regulator